MASVIQRLVVELTAQDQELQSKLARGEISIEKFVRQSTAGLSALGQQISTLEAGTQLSGQRERSLAELASIERELQAATQAANVPLQVQIKLEEQLARTSAILKNAGARGVTAAKPTAAEPDTDAIARRIALLQRGASIEATRGDSLRRLIAEETQLQHALQSSNLTLEQRIQLQETLGRVQSTITENTRATATAANGLGQRFATASVQIAGATESIARSGAVSGEAAKQLINQGSQIAFLFSGAGPIVGAIGITVLAIVELFQRAAQEAAETQAKIQRTIRELRQETSLQSASDRSVTLFSGDATITPDFIDAEVRAAKDGQAQLRRELEARAAGVQKLRAEIERLKAAQAAIPRPDAATAQNFGEEMQAASAKSAQFSQAIAKQQALLELIQPEYDAAQAAVKRLTTAEVERTSQGIRRDSETKGTRAAEQAREALQQVRQELTSIEASLSTTDPLDNIAAKFDALRTKVLSLKGEPAAVIAELTTEVERLRQAAINAEQAKLDKVLDDLAIRESATLTDDLRQRFDALLETLTRSGSGKPAFLARVEEIRQMGDASVTAQREVEGLATEVGQLRDRVGSAGIEVVSEQQIDRLIAMRDQAQAITDSEQVTAEVRERAKQQLAQINALLEQLLGTAFKIPEQTDKTNRHLSATTSNLLGAAAAAVQLADAMGLVEDRTAQAVVQAINLTKNVAEAIATRGKKGVPEAIGNAIALAQTLFGKSPADAQRAKELEENTRALQRLTKNVGDLLSLDLSGRQVGDVRKGVDALLGATGTAGGFRRFGDDGPLRGMDPRRFIESLGLDFDDVEAAAKHFGITLNGTKQSYLDLAEAIRNADLEAFLDTFAGKLEQLEATERIHGVTDPIEQFINRAKLLAENSPVFARIFQGLDLRSAAGRADAAKRLREEWDRFMADPESFRKDIEASGLSLAEWKQQMLEANEALTEGALALSEFTDALSDIDVDLEIAGNTNPVARAKKAAEAAAAEDERFGGLLGFDFSTAEGRAQAERFLQDLAKSADEDTKQIILELLRAIREIPDAVGRDPGEVEITGNAAEGLTEVTGTLLTDLARTANILHREEVVLLGGIRDLLGRTSAFGTQASLNTLPLPTLGVRVVSVSGGTPASTTTQVTIAPGALVVNVPPNVTNQKALEDFLDGPFRNAVARKISEAVAEVQRESDATNGIVRVRG